VPPRPYPLSANTASARRPATMISTCATPVFVCAVFADFMCRARIGRRGGKSICAAWPNALAANYRCFLSDFLLLPASSRCPSHLPGSTNRLSCVVVPSAIMIVNLPSDGASVAVEAVPCHPDSIVKPALDLQLRQEAADLLTSARCPVCRTPLVARMTCQGPRFMCLCDETRRHGNGVVKPPKV
jgi:hypothetical protein